MGLFGGSSVIEWEEYNSDTIFWKWPDTEIKKGSRLKKPCHLVDLIPTVCYVTGLPVPNGAEGAVLYGALEDPEAPFHQIERLEKSLDKLENALNKEKRPIWEHHDCI